jgi:hypothetical protein
MKLLEMFARRGQEANRKLVKICYNYRVSARFLLLLPSNFLANLTAENSGSIGKLYQWSSWKMPALFFGNT